MWLKVVKWLKGSYLWVLLAIFLIPLVIRFYRSQISKLKQQTLQNQNDENANFAEYANIIDVNERANKILIDKGVNDVQVRDRLINASSSLAIAFGTYAQNSWYQGWFEDEETALDFLKREIRNLRLIELVYSFCFTEAKNLKNDCYAYLSTFDIQELKNHQAQYNVTYF